MDQCKNCTQIIYGRYCSACGQKVYTEKDKSVKKLFSEAFHFLTHFEGKFFTTFKSLYRQPGRLSLDYSNGIRQKYYKPVSFYLLIVVLYLVFPLFGGLNMEMKLYEKNMLTGSFIAHQIDQRLSKEKISEEALTEKFKHKSESTSKVLLFLLIPLTIPGLYMLYFKKSRNLFDNFILSAELNIFYILTFYVIIPVFVYLFILISGIQPGPDAISTFLSFIFIIYLFILFKNVFREKWYWTFLKSVVFAAYHIAMVTFIYKFIVFEVTFYLI